MHSFWQWIAHQAAEQSIDIIHVIQLETFLSHFSPEIDVK